MRAHNDIHLPALQLLYHLLLLFRCFEAGKVLHEHRKTLETPHDGLIMLKGEDGGRHEKGALPALRHALEGGAQGDLRFAEAHVSA